MNTRPILGIIVGITLVTSLVATTPILVQQSYALTADGGALARKVF